METPWEPKEVDCGTKGSRGQISSEFQKVIEKLVGNSSVLKFEEDFKRLHYQTYFEFRSFNRSTPPELAPFATSESADIQVHNDSDIKPLRRFFRVGTTLAIPWSYPSTDPDTGLVRRDAMGNEIWEGYCIELVEKLAEDMKFDYQLVIKESFGKRSPNGTWSGLVGDLATGQIDLISTGLTMTSEREEVIDFVPPYFDQTGITIVIRKGIRKTTIFKFMTVLKLEVWLSIVAALIMTAVLLCLLDKYSPYSAQNNPRLYPYECRKFTLKESFWFALTSFTPQGGGETPKSCSARVLVSAYWLFVVLMLATFTANLAAFLTVERMQSPVQSLEQLAKQSRITYSVVNGSSTHQYFKNMKFAEDTLYRVWKEITLNASSDQSQYRVWDYPIKEQYGHILYAIEQGGPVPNASVGFQRVIDSENGEFALIHDSAEIKYEVSRNCNLTEVGEIFAEQPYALAVQQGSRLQEEISRNILDLQKDRFFEILTAKYWNSSQRGQCSDADDNEGITLESLGGVFIATICGLILAMITLSFEVYFHKRKKRTQTTPVASGGAESKNPVGAGPTKLMYAKEFESAVMRNRREFTEAWKKGGNNIQFITVQPRSHLY
ncbi:ionotropic receptor 25a [Bemisia tabaci]